MNKLVLFALIALLAGVMADNYAVLVAGSNSYGNYRHQSDVCHAYHTLLAKGYKADNIIVFSYNDVAKDSYNPFPNKLFNKPTYDKEGVDVNDGCVIDYEGDDVNPDNYIAVIQGQKNKVKGGNKRVLKSGQKDHVFLAFFDHGAPGLIAFPNDFLYAKKLLTAFKYMNKNKLYGRLVYYLEACESGSMFQDLPKNINIYALSAANPNESSWAAYCGQDAFVGGKDIGSCLGDLFSVSWMEDTDNHSKDELEKYTLDQQFAIVKNLTNQSQVMQWGDMDWKSEPVGDYLTDITNAPTESKWKAGFKWAVKKVKSLFNFGKKHNKNEKYLEPKKGLIDSRQATLHFLLKKFHSNPSTENYNELTMALKLSDKFARKFQQFADKLNLQGTSNTLTTDFDCYANLIDTFQSQCGKIPESQLSGLKYLYEFCAHETYRSQDYKEVINQIC